MKKIIRVTIRILITTCIILIFCEIGLRLLGYKVGNSLNFNFRLKNVDPVLWVKNDSLLGFSFVPGKCRYEYESGYSFSATHDNNGYRRSGPQSIEKLPVINFYGCSFFYGYGLNDSAVFTWKLQQKLKNYQINNCSAFALNMVRPLLLLQKQISAGCKPKIAVISYSSFNLSRNVFAFSFRKNVNSSKKIEKEGKVKYVYARLCNNSQQFEFKRTDFINVGFPLTNHSVLMNKIEESYINIENYFLQPKTVDSLLIEAYIRLCQKNDIHLIFAFITKDPHSKMVFSQLSSRGINCVDLFVDFNNVKLNLLPYDNHLNESGHSLYAIKIATYLQNKKLLK